MAIEGRQLPFAEAIDFFNGKVNLPTKKSDDLRHDGHVRGFSVAGVERDDMLADFRAAMAKAQTSGTGLQEFRKDFDAIVDRTGWKFNARGSTDEERRAWRARIIYKTNMCTSYMAGRYKQMTDPDVLRYRPWWRYRHSNAVHPRLTHLALDGKVFAATDPIWKVYFPPNGWGCGCDVEALSDRQLHALGKSGPDPWPLGEQYEGRDPRTGEPEIRYPGIDRGWEYNVGQSWLDGIVPPELREPLKPFGSPPAPAATLPALPAPTPVAAERLLPKVAPDADFVSAFLGEFGLKPGESKLHRDASGAVIAISQRLLEERDIAGNVVAGKAGKNGRGPYMRLIADTIIDPDEIWADWRAVTSGVVLMRSYLKRFVLPGGVNLLARFEWTSKGWIAVTGFDGSATYLQRLRTGALLYRRP